MKKIFTLSILALLVLSSCEDRPYADFTVSDTNVGVGEPVYFTNYSEDYYTLEWDFDDGTYSNVIDPIHAFPVSGTYRVQLHAYGHEDRVSTASVTIRVEEPPTLLNIEVVEWIDEYIIPDAEVTLFTSLRDWEDIVNPLITGYTDRYGEVVFEGLPLNRNFYVDASDLEHHNYWLAEDDIEYIRIPPLKPHVTNYFTAWVDYDPEYFATLKKGEITGARPKYKIMKIEPRNPEDKSTYVRKPKEEKITK
ncbi:MAG: PKD domain-containing protein [Bacteroidales bacterium]